MYVFRVIVFKQALSNPMRYVVVTLRAQKLRKLIIRKLIKHQRGYTMRRGNALSLPLSWINSARCTKFKARFISARAFSRSRHFRRAADIQRRRKASHPRTREFANPRRRSPKARRITEDMQIILSLPHGPLRLPTPRCCRWWRGRIFCITVAREWYYET